MVSTATESAQYLLNGTSDLCAMRYEDNMPQYTGKFKFDYYVYFYGRACIARFIIFNVYFSWFWIWRIFKGRQFNLAVIKIVRCAEQRIEIARCRSDKLCCIYLIQFSYQFQLVFFYYPREKCHCPKRFTRCSTVYLRFCDISETSQNIKVAAV